MEGASASRDEQEIESSHRTSNLPKESFPRSSDDSSEDVRVLTVDKLTVETIVLEKGGSREVLLKKSESTKKSSERTTRLPVQKSRSSFWYKRSSSTDELSTRIQKFKIANSLDLVTNATDSKNISRISRPSDNFLSSNEKKISSIKLTKSSSIGSLTRFNKTGKTSLTKIRKIPPKVPAKPKKKTNLDVSYFGPILKPVEISIKPLELPKSIINEKIVTESAFVKDESSVLEDCMKKSDDASLTTTAQELLEKSQSQIEKLQKNLRTQINVTTAETYKQKLPVLNSLRLSSSADLDLNENITKSTTFDKEFLERHSYDTELKIEEKSLLETDIDSISDTEKIEGSEDSKKPRYSKKVLEIEKRWSGEFLESNFEQNSSESSYVEELGSISSRESIKDESKIKFSKEEDFSNYDDQIERSSKHGAEETFEETVSTVDSDSCLEDRIKAIDDDIDESLKTEGDEEIDFLKENSKKSFIECLPEENLSNLETNAKKDEEERIDSNRGSRQTPDSNQVEISIDDNLKEPIQSVKPSSSPDGYASLIKEITMEAGSSKSPKEEKKKKSGLRRLLPGIFSPKESRKDFKREQKERKKRDEKHFHQYQQNGIYTRSPDSMNLNEDITRNVKLDTSLNSSIIEERLNEIKQELFPEQGMTTSTPDHFLQNDRTLIQDPRTARSFTVNSSLSSIAPEEKWFDHNIISGSPDLRKFKQMQNEEQKCNLERKHSFQESNQARFLRNHGPSGRISAPPSERFLIRPRAVHPIDRPLPAIPQKLEFSNYENQKDLRKYMNYYRRDGRIEQMANYPADAYYHTGNQNYENQSILYDNGNQEKPEINRNQSIDSGFNPTPVSAQVMISRQLMVNQNQKPMGRSPKYSPSLSQKSGDYADSTYTPNSSQKSEFSPGSSKSGEYYLNSPRNSCRTSPDESYNERKDQMTTFDNRHDDRDVNENRELSQNPAYPVSPKIRIESKDDEVYDEQVNETSSSRQINLNQDNYGTQKCSPNIPMSSNLAKLRANVEGSESPTNVERSCNENDVRSRVTSPVPSVRVLVSPVHFRDTAQQEDGERQNMQNLPRVISPTRVQRITSPLTILTQGNSPVPTATPNMNESKPSPRILVQNSPQDIRQRKLSNRTPVVSPNMNHSRNTPSSGGYAMTTFNSRRAQPNDQILIASPKREGSIYETHRDRFAGHLESGCPDSPVPMAESPSQISVPRTEITHQNKREANLGAKSPTPQCSEQLQNQVSPNRDVHQMQRNSPIVRPMSPAIDKAHNIQRPEPIYLRRQGRLKSPMTIQAEEKPRMYSEENRGTLLVPVQPGISNQNQETIERQKGQEAQNLGNESREIYVERRVQSPSGVSRRNLQRPEIIYVQREHALIVSSPENRDSDPSVSSPNRLIQSQQQMNSRRVRRASENIYEDRKLPRSRENSMSERIYGTRNSEQSPIPLRTVVDQNGQSIILIPQNSKVISRSPQQQQAKIYVSKQEVQAENLQQNCPNQQPNRNDPIYGQKVPKRNQSQEHIYAQRSEPIYGQQSNRQLSPSKRQMMQHLEAFYWQQKALDAQRKSTNSPTPNRICDEANIAPEVREAIYWQQLKKLDEEQQRKIFEENQLEQQQMEKNDPIYWRKQGPGSPSVTDSSRHGSAPSLANQNMSLAPNQQQSPGNTAEQIYWQNKAQKSQIPVGKPPIVTQKGQNQPILVVRPQQAVRQLDRVNPDPIYDQRDGEARDGPRSKSVSPHFARSDERRSLSLPRKVFSEEARGKTNRTSSTNRKATTPSIYDSHDIENSENKKSGPPPIFKRGSLISNSSSSVEYGPMGTKRVSFSNQSNSPEVGSGNWPTKHGMAPEPPTRKHRTEERSSLSSEASDSVYGQEENSNIVYGNIGKSGQTVPIIEGQVLVEQRDQKNALYEAEYDAKPLPPPPRDSSWMLKRSSSLKESSNNSAPRMSKVEIQRAKVLANPRKWPGLSESESGSEAGEVQKILQRRNEEEWNPGGKGRQSNDTGGSGRAEGEGGSNDLAVGRRGGGVLGGGRGSGISGGGAGGRSRDEPRRHTLSGDHQPSLHHQQFNAQQLHPLHPHHLPPPHGQYGTPPNRHTTMDLEMGTKSRQRKSPLPRGYPPPSTALLFDDDPGIMSEVETSSTGFRRGGKQRSSLPVVRTPSKTLERPLGQVFLQYRNETKRALLPNEITSIDTVKALFVRSFPKQLTMEYLDSPHVKVYIHDSSKNMFYELEDLRSHLRDIRDRSVLRLFESTDGVAGMPGPMGVPVGAAGLPPHWEDQSYFSEPEFDSEFQHQHIHKSKTSKNSSSGSSYYIGGSSTLPRGGSLMRAYSPAASSVVAGPNATPAQPKSLGTPGGGGVAPAKPLRSYQCGKSPLGSLGGSARFSRDSSVSLYSIPDRLHGESGYMSSPERGGGVGTGSGRYPGGPYSTGSSYEEPYYSQYSGTVTPVIDEEASDTELLEESYSLYGVKPPGRPPSGPPRSPFPPGAPALPPGQPYDVTRIRVEQMERQLANLTGLVQKALTHAPHTSPSPRDYLQVPAARDPYTRSTGVGDEFDKHSSSSSASLPDKSVSFEKSVSFSDEPPDMNSPKQHSPQHAADTKPTKPAIKSSTLPRMSSQERDRHKPTPPPKPVALAPGQYVYRDLALTPEMYNQLRGLQKKANDLRQEVRNLRRMSQTQAHTVRETIRDTFITIRAMLLSGGDAAWAAGDTEKMRLSREEDLYKQEMIRLEKDLTELESTVEELRGNVITRQTRVNMSDVENMALILSKSSKTVADLKVRFPSLQEGMKGLLSSEMEKVVREEKFLKEEPERLESALRRCKKLTGTLVTLKRLASVQEQRSPNAASVDTEETPPITPTSAQHSKATAPVPAERTVVGSAGVIGGGPHAVESSAPNQQRPENALDALLDELQTFSRPTSQLSQASMHLKTGNHMPSLSEIGRSASQIVQRAPNMSDIGRKGSVDSSTSLAILTPGHTSTLRRLHSYPSSSDTDTSPPIARLQEPGTLPQKPPVPERNAELLQLATARRVPPPPPPRTSSRSPLASPTSPQLPPRNPTGTLRRGRTKEMGKPPMALPPNANEENPPPSNMLSASNSSSCESINSQEGLQNKKGRQEQLEQRHQELLRKQKALQEQYARLQQLHRNASGLATVPPAPPDLLKKTGSESNLLAKMGLGLSTTSSGSLTSLTVKVNAEGQQQQSQAQQQTQQQQQQTTNNQQQSQQQSVNDQPQNEVQTNQTVGQTTTNKIYETDIL